MSIPAVCTLLMVDVSKSRAVPPMPFNPFQTGRLQMTGVITRLSWDCCYLPDTRSKPFQFGASRLHVSSVMMQFNSIDSQFYSLYRLRLQSPAFFLCLRKISNIWFSKRVVLLCRMQIGLARRGTAGCNLSRFLKLKAQMTGIAEGRWRWWLWWWSDDRRSVRELPADICNLWSVSGQCNHRHCQTLPLVTSGDRRGPWREVFVVAPPSIQSSRHL